MSTMSAGTVSESRPGKPWSQACPDMPWFDRPDALEVLDRRMTEGHLTEQQYELLRKWTADGYFVLSGIVPEEHVDQMQQDLDGLWSAEEPTLGLRVEELRVRPEDPPGLTHEELLRLPREDRMRLRSTSTWRVHGFHLFSKSTRAIYQNEELTEVCSLIFDAPAEPSYTINFMYGSRQGLHQDTAVFHIHPPNYLIGSWLACEDISPDSGPLVYYPGSHKEGMFDRFDNYPQTNLRTCSPEDQQGYYRWINEVAGRYERKTFIAEKGDVLLWHGMLIHGGDEVRRPELMRRSYVCHYVAQGKNRHHDVEGPFNW